MCPETAPRPLTRPCLLAAARARAPQRGQPSIKLWDVDKELGGWETVQAKFFDAGQVLDQLQAESGARRMAAQRGRASGGNLLAGLFGK